MTMVVLILGVLECSLWSQICPALNYILKARCNLITIKKTAAASHISPGCSIEIMLALWKPMCGIFSYPAIASHLVWRGNYD